MLVEVKSREGARVLLSEIVRRGSVERQVRRTERGGRQVAAQVTTAAVGTIQAWSTCVEEATVVKGRGLEVQ